MNETLTNPCTSCLTLVLYHAGQEPVRQSGAIPAQAIAAFARSNSTLASAS